MRAEAQPLVPRPHPCAHLASGLPAGALAAWVGARCTPAAPAGAAALPAGAAAQGTIASGRKHMQAPRRCGRADRLRWSRHGSSLEAAWNPLQGEQFASRAAEAFLPGSQNGFDLVAAHGVCPGRGLCATGSWVGRPEPRGFAAQRLASATGGHGAWPEPSDAGRFDVAAISGVRPSARRSARSGGRHRGDRDSPPGGTGQRTPADRSSPSPPRCGR